MKIRTQLNYVLISPCQYDKDGVCNEPAVTQLWFEEWRYNEIMGRKVLWMSDRISLCEKHYQKVYVEHDAMISDDRLGAKS